MFTGVVIFERTDFPVGQPGNRFDSNPMVFVTDAHATYGEARNAATELARETLRNGAMVQEGMGMDVSSMREAADRIFAYNNATYSFELPDGKMGDFLVRWSIADK